MSPETLYRARTILKRNGVKLCEDSGPSIKHFLVTQRDGSETDVWRVDAGGITQWSCNAIDKNKMWGCVLYTGKRNTPFCSHTLAVKLFMKEQEQNLVPTNQDSKKKRKNNQGSTSG